MKTKLIAIGSGIVILGYAAASIVPGLFNRRGYTPDEIRRLTVVAHRGGAALEPENTLRAIERGIACGADMTRPPLHDADGRPTDLRIPTLDDVLALVDGRARLLVEIKRPKGVYEGIEQRMLDAFARHGAEDWVVVQSFNDDVLEITHHLNPDIRLEKLLICKLRGMPYIFDGSLTRFDYNKYAHVASFNFFSPAVTRGMVDELHAHGKEVKIWTLDAPADAPHLPVDGIITDHPDLWKR